MSTTEQRLAANRANAQLSTGPSTAEGKAVASRNATRHGLLSARMFLDDEDPAEFHALCAELDRSLKPADAIEGALIERIAVTLWRQRRLVASEAATLALARQPRKIASGVGNELGRGEMKIDELRPFDPDSERWARDALAEIEALDSLDLVAIEKTAPVVWGQLCSDAEPESVEKFLAEHQGGLAAFITELVRWCREQLRQAEARPHTLALAEQVRAKRLLLSPDTLELLARYQSTLDNQLYKALRALREAQAWRRKTLEHREPVPTMPPGADAEPMSEAA